MPEPLELDLGLPAVAPLRHGGAPAFDVPSGLEFAVDLVVNVARKQACDVYVGRSFAGRADQGWGNPHPMRGNSERARLVAVSAWHQAAAADAALTERAQRELAGRVLGCWCAPKLCHGHLLAGVAAGRVDLVGQWADALAARAAATPRRLLVTGSRHWSDELVVAELLERAVAAWSDGPDPVLVVGDATGVDAIAAAWWGGRGLPVEVFEADWEALGRKAGPRRNASMVSSGVDWCLALPIGESAGTRGCAALARKAGVPVTLVEG